MGVGLWKGSTYLSDNALILRRTMATETSAIFWKKTGKKEGIN